MSRKLIGGYIDGLVIDEFGTERYVRMRVIIDQKDSRIAIRACRMYRVGQSFDTTVPIVTDLKPFTVKEANSEDTYLHDMEDIP